MKHRSINGISPKQYHVHVNQSHQIIPKYRFLTTECEFCGQISMESCKPTKIVVADTTCVGLSFFKWFHLPAKSCRCIRLKVSNSSPYFGAILVSWVQLLTVR